MKRNINNRAASAADDMEVLKIDGLVYAATIPCASSSGAVRRYPRVIHARVTHLICEPGL